VILGLGYEQWPVLAVGSENDVRAGWRDIGAEIVGLARRRDRCVVAVECYPGVFVAEARDALAAALAPAAVIEADDAILPPDELARVLAPYLGDDPVFGRMSPLGLESFFARERVAELRRRLMEVGRGIALVVGTGATLVTPDADLVAYADVTRWEIQQRQRRHRSGNLGADNAAAPAAELYKRSYFVDWRAADRWKNELLDRVDWYLDTNEADAPRLVAGSLYRRALAVTARRPFRLVPLFDPGPWGGEWMRRTFGLPPEEPNFAWCFDCVPEENSLLFGFGSRTIHSPALPVVQRHALDLLGPHVVETFGAEFPIRFDLLDTWEGGNLSLQVHPLREYIRERFGMGYTQDESYYLLDAKPGAQVYLGFNEAVDPARFTTELEAAQNGGPPFDPNRHVRAWGSTKHAHFSIPAGTIHCSGRDNVVLEISAAPYIFTFKLWDWGRLDLHGNARPIHLDDGLANLQWQRTSEWVGHNLVDRVAPVAHGDGWHEESTGLHPLEFIETRRHWFTGPVEHHTHGTVNVLNLVEGRAGIVESPTGDFEPLVVHYAETFVVPASVGAYRIRPFDAAQVPLATVKAYVRENAAETLERQAASSAG
jgi:mannose-6-phosphate isomerase class I